MPDIEVHLFLPQVRLSIDDIVERARAAEAAGFDGIAFMDHLSPPMASSETQWEAMTLAGWVLARTDRLRVGHLVLCDAMRHPAVLAKQAVTLDHASGGRFDLGLGWGSLPRELAAFGITTDEAPQRVARLSESLEVIRRLWSGEEVDYEGSRFTLSEALQQPRPLTGSVPLLIGGVGAKTVALAAKYADWWNVPITSLGRLEELRPKAGSARVSVQEMVAYVADESRRDEVAYSAQRRFGAMAAAQSMIIGTGAELVDHLGSRARQGVERCYVWFTDFAPVETITVFGEQVLEAIRS